jgi:hypothetical protein
LIDYNRSKSCLSPFGKLPKEMEVRKLRAKAADSGIFFTVNAGYHLLYSSSLKSKEFSDTM